MAENDCMSRVVLKIKDESKAEALIHFLEGIDFLEVNREKVGQVKRPAPSSFLSSAGMWSGRKVEAKDLRDRAWQHGSL